ncbi:hypothetical protein GCM10028771_33950 [Nocardioides marmoraquaticus]
MTVTTTRTLVGGLAAALVCTLGSISSAPVAGATPAGATVAAAVTPVAARLTPREKRLAKRKRCTPKQKRQRPVLCRQIARAKAKAAASAPKPTAPKPSQPDPTASSFTLAVMPDTQQEVFGRDPRMRQRSDWLVSQRERLDLRFVTHVGDVTNWGWLAPDQYRVASEGLRPLEQAGVPYSLSIGNHDTRAIGWDGRGNYGGGAYVQNPECARRLGAPACKTDLLVRRTDEFNDVFTASRFGAVAGAFEPGKVDNTYSTFAADGYDWLVLNLELWPRAAAVDWAKRVVAGHPDHNVVVVTHSYLNGSGGIYDRSDYGSTSPRYLWDNLVSRYANIKLVLSGHVGSAALRVDTGRQGNKVVSLLQTFHSNDANPVRLLQVNPSRGSFTTSIVSPNGRGGDFSKFDKTVTGMTFVR